MARINILDRKTNLCGVGYAEAERAGVGVCAQRDDGAMMERWSKKGQDKQS
jgi:hypothetical protein